MSGFVIPVLVIQNVEGCLELLNLLQHTLALLIDEPQTLGNGGVAFDAPVDEGFDVFDCLLYTSDAADE